MANSSLSLISEELDIILDNGFISPKCSGCCPDCGNIYILASVETYLKFYEEAGEIPVQEDCCTNTCITKLQDYATADEFDQFIDRGIVEYSTFNGKSFICYIVDYFIANPSALGNSSFGEVLNRILDKGIVIYCTEDQQIVAGVETFLKLNFIIDYGAECCLSLTANVDTYAKYQEAVGLTPPPLIP